MQTAETAWLFLQLVIRQLKDGGRCGIVAPNGLLFGGGVGARIKKQLLAECNLHTIVRLPDGVFAPYTVIPSNLLFFEKPGPTKEVWFYELPHPQDERSTRRPSPCASKSSPTARRGGARLENERAWRVSIADLESNDYNLDLRNPNRPDDLAHRPPAELLTELVQTEREILELLNGLQASVAEET